MQFIEIKQRLDAIEATLARLTNTPARAPSVQVAEAPMEDGSELPETDKE